MIAQWEKPWDARLQYLLTLIVALNVLPHATHVPVWALATSFIAIGWKLAYLKKGLPLPKKWVAQTLAVIVSGATLYSYRTLLGQEPAGTALIMLASLKLLETSRYRDALFVILTSYFLLMSHVLSSQSLLSTLFMGLDVLLITALMFHMHRRDRRSSVRSFRPVLRILALSIPVWLLFFLVFPRFSAAFWNVKSQQKGSGFSDDLNPGAISRIVESDEPAFRVTYTGERLAYGETLYWRGGILTYSEGLKWGKGLNLRESGLVEPDPDAKRYNYEVWLEPTSRRWLFALDFPMSFEVPDRFKNLGVRRLPGMIYETSREVQNRIVYKATASLGSPTESLSASGRRLYLQLPPEFTRGKHPEAKRLQQLAAQIQERARVPKTMSRGEVLSNYMLLWFRRENFAYTREPGALTAKDSLGQLAEFVFETKKGFCEHYASAYANMMRLMGVPARVVIGYQGGRWNDLGEYLVVRQVDAHAWAEYWKEDLEDPERGKWIRADPTAFVAPLRIQAGGDYNRVDNTQSPDSLQAQLEQRRSSIARRFVATWDMMQMRWNTFLLSFDFEYQLSLLRLLGVSDGSRFMLVVLLFMGLAMIGATFVWALRKRAHRKDLVYLEWQSFCMKLEAVGIAKGKAEGPLHFAERASRELPAHREQIHAIATEYIGLRYGDAQAHNLRELRQSVRRFSIRSSSPSIWS